MSEKRIVLQRNNDLLYLQLNAPPANRTDFLFFAALEKMIARIRKEDNVRGLILHGAGRHFSSGADIEELQQQLFYEDEEATRKLLLHATSVVQDLSELPCPVVAAINGCCMGSGFELAMGCDYRVATKHAIFSMPEVTFGLIPGCGGTARLPGLAGLGRGIELILTGESFLAEEALAMGIVDRIAGKLDLLATAERMIDVFPDKRVSFSAEAGRR